VSRAPADVHELPGGEILAQGLADLAEGRRSASALLLRMAAPRLARLGIEIEPPDPGEECELELYRLLLAESPADAYGRYNAWLRRLASLCHALEARAARVTAPGGPSPRGCGAAPRSASTRGRA